MTDCGNDYQFNPKEEEKNEIIKKTSLPFNYNLNVIEESEENIKNKKDENLSDDESLGYNSNYRLFQNNNINKDYQNIKENTSKRKMSTLSTTISQTDIVSEANSFLPPNNIKTQIDRKTSYTEPSHVFFGRERLNSSPITNYYEGMDFYLRALQPEKNEYQKSHNYIGKEVFFKEKNISFKECKFKSFDLSEQKKFNSNQILKNLEENYKNQNDNKISLNIPLNNNLKNNLNNNQNIMVPITPKFNNSVYGKFDMPMYCFGYYNFDSKYYFNLIFYCSVKWNASNSIQSKKF